MVEMRRSQVDLNATDSLGRPLFSGSGYPLTYNDTPLTPFGALKEVGENLSLLGRDVFGRVLPQETGNFVDTLLAGQPYSPSSRTAVSMPINVGNDGVVDTYNYDEDMSAPPEYNNAVPMVVNRNREVNVRPWVKDIGRSVNQTYNDILNRFTEEKLGSPTGETVLSIPLNNETTPVDPEAGLENEFRDTGSPGKYKIQSDRQIEKAPTFGSQKPIEVGENPRPPSIFEGLVTSVPTDEVFVNQSKLTYPDRTPNPEVNTDILNLGKGLLGGGNVGDMITGAIVGNPASAAMKVANDESLSPGQRIGAGATAGAMALGNMLGGPAAGIMGLLGGLFNSMGAYQDPNEVTGNIAMSRGGTLSGDTSGPGGIFYQSGSLNNFNFFDDLAATQPNAIVDYKGLETNAAGARNLSGLENFNIGGVQDAIDAGDATGGWGSYDDPGMTADNSGWG